MSGGPGYQYFIKNAKAYACITLCEPLTEPEICSSKCVVRKDHQYEPIYSGDIQSINVYDLSKVVRRSITLKSPADFMKIRFIDKRDGNRSVVNGIGNFSCEELFETKHMTDTSI